MKLLFPDSLNNIENISCANFLYFKKESVALPLQPSISMPIGGCNPYEFLLYAQARHPKWQNTYFTIYNEWVKTTKGFGQTFKCLEPLREIGVMKSILISYSKTEKTLCDTIAFIKSTKISYKDLISMIDLDPPTVESKKQ